MYHDIGSKFGDHSLLNKDSKTVKNTQLKKEKQTLPLVFSFTVVCFTVPVRTSSYPTCPFTHTHTLHTHFLNSGSLHYVVAAFM